MRVETIGNATVYLGDSREIVQSLNGVACVVTSPPYNQLGATAKPSGLWKANSFGNAVTQDWAEKGYFDSLTETEYQIEQNKIFADIAAACNHDASLFYNHQLRWRNGDCLHPAIWFHPENWRMRTEVIWDRGGGMMLNARMFCRYDERILWFVRGKKWKWNQDQVGLGTVWRISVAQNKDHPVAFPVEMPLRCIMATTDLGDVVLDPYSGSASTGVAAVTTGRKYIGIERDEKYFDLGCRRLEQAQRQGDLFIEGATP